MLHLMNCTDQPSHIMLIPEISRQKDKSMESRTTTQTATYYNRIRKLTRIESMLLKKLLENRGRIITIGTLEQNLYGERCDKIH